MLTHPHELMLPNATVWVRGEEWHGISSVIEFRSNDVAWRRIFRANKSYAYSAAEVNVRTVSPLERDVLAYLRKAVDALAPEGDRKPPLQHAYRDFSSANPDSVLSFILSQGRNQPHKPLACPIEPFASNFSQRRAVEIALCHRISLIEGPPGTGKTQTILNLIASLIAVPEITVGVVSANNAAVENVAEKLQKHGYGFVVAELGNSKKREAFERNRDQWEQEVERWLSGHTPVQLEPNTAFARLEELNRLQLLEQDLHKLHATLDAHRHEYDRFEQWVDDHINDLSGSRILNGQPSRRILTLLAESELDGQAGPIRSWIRRLSRRVRFGDLQGIDLQNTDDVVSLHRLYYQRRIDELEREVAGHGQYLRHASLDQLATEQKVLSGHLLDDGLWRRYSRAIPSNPGGSHAIRKVTSQPASHPVVISTCHSLRSSIGSQTILDVIIIDEASQLDLLAGALALANCRSVVVVGDQKQLSHIPPKLLADIGPPPLPAFDIAQHSVMSGLASFYGDSLPRTLLREHYRCDPSIIEFCNAKFYDGSLIPYTTGAIGGEPALSVVKTAPGRHLRQFHRGGYLNHREIDAIVEELMPALRARYTAEQIGITTPYRAQANIATTTLSDCDSAIQSDTVHKYQGREKEVMILSTVLDNSRRGPKAVEFVDDPRLVNVAVSRAVQQFILVTHPSGMPTSRHIKDLIGYIEFRNPEAVHDSRLVSIFDLLYSEYAAELEAVKPGLLGSSRFPSENLASSVLKKILTEYREHGLSLTPQVLLSELVADTSQLSQRESAFVGNRASVDFVVRRSLTREPILAIEVDGYTYHENKPSQLERDEIKNRILWNVGLPLLRLPTTGHSEQSQIRAALNHILSPNTP